MLFASSTIEGSNADVRLKAKLNAEMMASPPLTRVTFHTLFRYKHQKEIAAEGMHSG